MTEEEIERRVEKYVDNLDRRYLRNQGMTQADYDKEMADLNAWADAKREENERIEKQKKADEEAGVPLGWTGAQVRALRDLYERSADGAGSYAVFEARAHKAVMMDCLMLQWCGMWIGIEPDGYTHS